MDAGTTRWWLRSERRLDGANVGLIGIGHNALLADANVFERVAAELARASAGGPIHSLDSNAAVRSTA